MKALLSIVAALALGVAAAEVCGTCSATSGCDDCSNVDFGSCGNACCKMELVVSGWTTEDMVAVLNETIFSTAANPDGPFSGPDGYYSPQFLAEGVTGFASLVGFGAPVDYIGQVHHMTSGPAHYNDTIDMTVRSSGDGVIVKLFSLSLIGGALGDAGQNYKNIVQITEAVTDAVNAVGMTNTSLVHVDDSCPEP